MSRFASAGPYLAMIVALLAEGITRIGLPTGDWDAGNLLYDSWRVMLGQLPNVDFVSGYPGGHNLLLAGLMGLFGVSVESAHVYPIVGTLVLGSILYWFSRRFVRPWLAALTAFVGASASMFVWWSPNPGTLVEIAMLLLVLAGLKWVRSEAEDWRLALLAGLLVGVALAFKQSAIFVAVGWLYVLWWAFAIRFPYSLPAPARITLTACGFLLPIVFVGYRAGPGFPPANYLALAPWLAVAVYLLWRTRQTPAGASEVRRGPSTSTAAGAIAASGVGVFLGIAPLVLWYAAHSANLTFVLQEMLVRVPRLIDRHVLPVKALGARDLAVLGVGGALLSLTRHSNDRLRAGGLLAIAGGITTIALAGVAGRLLALPGTSVVAKVTSNSLLPVSYSLYWFSLLACLLAVAAIEIGRRSGVQEDERRSEYLVVLLVIAGPWFASMYPYPATFFTGGVTVLLLVCAMAVLSRSAEQARCDPAARGLRVSPALSITCAIVVAASTLVQLPELPFRAHREYIEVTSPRWRGLATRDLMPFVELSEYIGSLPTDTGIATYPNLSLSLFLAGKLTPTRYGNYLGDFDHDLKGLIAEIRDDRVDIVIVNRDLYPSPPGFPYFVDPARVVDLLGNDFALVHRESHFDVFKRSVP